MSITEGPNREVIHTETSAPLPPPAVVDNNAPVVATPVEPVRAEEVRTTYGRRFTPDTFVAGLVGLAALIIGLIVVVRAGLDAPMSSPVVEVLGFTHTATLGLVEIGVGLFLLIAASARSRGAELFGGLAMVVGGVVGVAQYRSFTDTLALERGWAWIVLIAGAVVALAALLFPRITRRAMIVEQRTV
jgi:hypothetical protein